LEIEKFIEDLALEMPTRELERNTWSDIDLKLFDRACDRAGTRDILTSESIGILVSGLS
jgi:hypothetical protein